MSLSRFAMPAGLAVAALLVAGTASAQMKVRVTNAGVNPVTFSLDGKSKDIRPRKALTFTVDKLTPTYSLFFLNGVGDRGEVELAQSAPVTGAEDGLTYYCLRLEETGMEVEPKEDCDKRVNKPKE